jgi:Protein of unknown function (DUF3054)
MRATPASSPALLVAGLDTVLLLVFAGVGRRSHGEGIGGLAVTAFPLVSGWLIAALASGALRDRSLRLASLTWLAAWPLAMALRAVTGRGLAPGFLIVSFLLPLALLLGARLLIGDRR